MKIEPLFVKPVFKILKFVLDRPTTEFYEKKVADSTGVSVGAISKYMRELTKMKILQKEKRGRMNFYRLNRNDAVIKQLKLLFTLSSPLVEEIKSRFDKFDKNDVEIWLYGSYARGEDVEDSDIDILLITNRAVHSKLVANLVKIGGKYEKKISVASFTRNDWIKMRKKDPAFYERVERDKIKLV